MGRQSSKKHLDNMNDMALRPGREAKGEGVFPKQEGEPRIIEKERGSHAQTFAPAL